ncbi:glucose PTS transporter subunit IIA [Paenibacillus turpanensis]|uniref:glucose PTS transporter subunit IIA n=1 Tax=Paenibacillus turpanensis TaxID=2689078 RepID=UPI00140CDA52|nr:glucose PTS transporter subunit IIA [Paenibacillus turpanensis]
MNGMGILQQFGRSLMLPMIALPAAALALFLSQLPWAAFGLPSVSTVLVIAGSSIFTYLPYIFAVGVALGLTESAGMAGMSALIGYFIYEQLTYVYLGLDLQLGVPGGILIGLVSALTFHRFKNVKLPEYIQFFGGPRIVPLLVSFEAVFISLIMFWMGSPLQTALLGVGSFLVGLGGFGAFLYGVFYRLLVPTGLHHILNNFVWFQVGSYELENGIVVSGDLPRFFAGDPTAGLYMAGLYPIMIFALPAIAFAIIHEAREDLKPKVRATFLTAAMGSALTGVTEPIEFAFLFAAPTLFAVHAILSGLAMWIAHLLDIHHGFSFAGGLIDFLMNYHLSKNAMLLLPVGIAYGFVYYFLFRWAIRRFQIPTPGREEGSPLEDWAGDIPYRSPLILQALGGKENIVHIEACITRLRLTLVNDRLADFTALKHLGAAGVIRLGGGNIQVVFGTFSELIREEIIKVLRKDVRQVHFHSPMQGVMIPLEEVPDAIFAGKLVGDGVAFFPDRGELVAPVKGRILHIYPTKHAIGIVTPEKLEVLLHIGIDSSQMEGKGMTVHVQEGDEVVPGQTLVRFDLGKLKKHAKSIATPMLITNPGLVKSWSFAPFKPVKKGQASVMSVILKEGETSDNKTNA